MSAAYPQNRAKYTRGVCPLPDRRKTPAIFYSVRGDATMVDHWTDPHDFTAAFPVLFPAEIGGCLDERDIPLSLVAFVL